MEIASPDPEMFEEFLREPLSDKQQTLANGSPIYLP
jgi:hypothetical protein